MEDFIGTPEEYNKIRFGIEEPYCSICNCMIEMGEEWEEEIVGESGAFLFRAALILPIYKTLKIIKIKLSLGVY